MPKENKSLQKQKKILIISRNFPPLTGGMEKLLFHTYQELSEINHCFLVGPKGCTKFSKNSSNTSESPASPILVFLLIALIKSFIICIRNKPSIIIGGSGIVAPIVLLLSKLFQAKSIIFVHGLDLIANSLVFQQFFLPCIRRSNLLIANSANTKALAVEKGAPRENVIVLNPGVEINISSPDAASQGPSLRQKYDLGDKHILLSVGRLIPRKGLPEFIEKSFVNIVAKNPETHLVIIGETPKYALNKTDSSIERIRAVIAKYQLEDKILLLGKVSDATLKNAYTEADLFIFPLIEVPGDVEGFGMVAIEAASYGRPVFAFNVGGVADAIIDGDTGFLVEPGNYNRLTEVIVDYFRCGNKELFSERCREHARGFSWQIFGEKLRNYLIRG